MSNHQGAGAFDAPVIDDDGNVNSELVSKLIECLVEAIPPGEHPHPHSERADVRLDAAQSAIRFIEDLVDHVDWLERGIGEWRDAANRANAESSRQSAALRVAVRHLNQVLNNSRSHDEQQRADTAARDWLESIGNLNT